MSGGGRRRERLDRDVTATKPRMALSLAVLDHEQAIKMRRLCPNSFEWDDPDVYLESCERLAQELAQDGHEVNYVFIGVDEYFQWCATNDRDFDSSDSRAAYAGWVATTYPEHPVEHRSDQPIVPLAILSMAMASDLDGGQSSETAARCSAEFFDACTDYLCRHEGNYRLVATAARGDTCDRAELWRHFRRAVFGAATLIHCPDCLSVIDTVENRGDQVVISDHGQIDPVEIVLDLGAKGRGLVGVERRYEDDLELRIFEIGAEGYRPVEAYEAVRRLGVPGSSSLRSGWD